MSARVAERPVRPSDRVVQTGSMLVGSVAGEIVALDVQRGLCFGMNPVASEVWRLIQAETLVSDVCRSLCAMYEVDAARCESEVISLLEDLRSEGLIELR